MTERIHLVLDAAEKERFRRMAVREGKTLSAWLREAARERAQAAEGRRGLETQSELKRFFDECDAREPGREPDWDQHKRLIGDSQRSGGSGA